MIFLSCLEQNKTWKSEKGIAHRPKKSENNIPGEAEYLANIATE